MYKETFWSLPQPTGTRKPLSVSFLSTNFVAGGRVWVLHTLHHKLWGFISFLFQIKIKSMLL